MKNKTYIHFRNYLGGDLLVALIGALTIPVLTNVLSVSEYGVLNVFMSYVSICSVILLFNVHSAVGRYYYEEKNNFNKFLGTTLILSVVMLIFFSIIFFFWHIEISVFSGFSYKYQIFIFLLVIFAVGEGVFRQIFQAKLKSGFLSVINVIKALSILILTVLIIFFIQDEKYVGPVYARLIVGGILFFYALYILRDTIDLVFHTEHVKYIVNYSVPLIPYALSSIILAQFDRVMVNYYEGPESAGLYSFAYNIGFLISLVITALNSSFYPKFFGYYNKQEYHQHDQEITGLHNFLLIASLFLILFGKEIGLILAPSEFNESLNVIPVVVISYVFYSLFVIYNRNIDFSKKTYYSSAILLLAGSVNVLLNIYFIPKYGFIAAAYTTLVSYILLFLLSWYISKYMLKIHTFSIVKLIIPMIYLSPIIIAIFLYEYFYETIIISFFLKIIFLIITIRIIYPSIFGIAKNMILKRKIL